MKPILKKFAFQLLLVIPLGALSQQSVGIGTPTPHASTILELASTNKGLLLPRLNAQYMPANPPGGLLLYLHTGNSNYTSGLYYRDNTVWQRIMHFSFAGTVAQNGLEISTTTGFAIKGVATGTSGANFGLYGSTLSANGYGVAGFALGTNGGVAGIYGASNHINASGGLFTNSGGGIALETAHGHVQMMSFQSGNRIYDVGSRVSADANGRLFVNPPMWAYQSGQADLITTNKYVGIGTGIVTSRVHIAHNYLYGLSSQLLLKETEDDYARLTLRSTANANRWDIAALTSNTNANAELNFFFSGLNTNVLSLRGNGNAIVQGTVTDNGVLLTSDERLKKDIKPLGATLEKLQNLTPYSYYWKDPAKSTEAQIGLMAQEVEKVFPELVHTNEQGMKYIAYMQLIPLMLKALQEQQEMLSQLKASIEKPENSNQ